MRKLHLQSRNGNAAVSCVCFALGDTAIFLLCSIVRAAPCVRFVQKKNVTGMYEYLIFISKNINVRTYFDRPLLRAIVVAFGTRIAWAGFLFMVEQGCAIGQAILLG